jgi:UDP-N-acetylglucosamine--N-acetylmuramyl-(pentapeptide) pyrophosphoryl-undecaprenol N-acetylglucosamine transferase
MLQKIGEKTLKTILLVTGGTGGHIFPALAVGDSLRNVGIMPIFIVRNNLGDINLVKQFGFKCIPLAASGFFGKNVKAVLLFLWNMIKAILRFPFILFKVKADAIIASGGFSSFVPIMWAKLLQQKYYLLEQNRIPGRLTKYFSRWAKEVYLGFPLLKNVEGNIFYSGNPLRSELLTQQRNDNGRTILVLGGSQGARFININIVELANQMQEFDFIIQTGTRDYQEINKSLKSNNCTLIDFTLSPGELYKKATIVITRAGAMVLSEILFFGIPSIIIPFPFATDNHQAANAQFLAQNNAAIILDQGHQSGLSNDFVEKLKLIIKNLFNNKAELLNMSENARRLARIDAANVIAYRVAKCLEN